MVVSYKFFLLNVITFLALSSCNSKNTSSTSKENDEYYYVRTLREHEDTVWSKSLDKPDSSFHTSITKTINSPLGSFKIEKFTNEPGAPIDGGMELFYENNFGVFYSRSLTWPEYTRLYSNNDSLDKKISFLIDRVLADPELCNYSVIDTSKIIFKKFAVPKIQ